MDIKQVKLELANNFGNTGLLNIQYHNKPDFVGYIHKIHNVDGDINEVDFTIVKHTTEVVENPYCNIDFENMKSITIKYQGSTLVKTYN